MCQDLGPHADGRSPVAGLAKPQGAKSTCHIWIASFEGERARVSRKRFCEALRRHEAPFHVGYTKRAAYQHPVFRKAFPKGAYRKGLCPNAERMVPRMVMGDPMVPMKEAERAADALAAAIREVR